MKKQSRQKVTRRNLLLGAGALGFLTTTTGISRAVLNESVEFNQTQIMDGDGLVDLRLDWIETYNGEVVEPPMSSVDQRVYRDDVSGPVLNLNGLMPGDHGTLTISPTVLDAEGEPTRGSIYMWFELAENPYRENSLVEPERKAGDDTPNQGELQDYMESSVWIDNGFIVAGGCDGTNDVIGDPELSGGTTFADVLDELSEPAEINECLGTDEEFCIGIEWEIPENADNVIQTDTIEFNLAFRTEPCGDEGEQ